MARVRVRAPSVVFFMGWGLGYLVAIRTASRASWWAVSAIRKVEKWGLSWSAKYPVADALQVRSPIAWRVNALGVSLSCPSV
jgi:hypothetical protein